MTFRCFHLRALELENSCFPSLTGSITTLLYCWFDSDLVLFSIIFSHLCALELRNRILQPQLARVLLTLIRPYDLSMFLSPCTRTWEFMFSESIPNWLEYDITVTFWYCWFNLVLFSIIFSHLRALELRNCILQPHWLMFRVCSHFETADLVFKLWLFNIFISVLSQLLLIVSVPQDHVLL